MSAANRGGVVGGVIVVIAALLYGAWTVSRPAPVAEAVPEPAPGQAAEADAPAAEVAEAAPEADAAEADAAAGAEETAEGAAVEVAPAEEVQLAPATDVADEAASDGAAEEVAAAPEAQTEPVAEPLAEVPAPEVVAEPVIAPPSFDLVRVEQDGSALVAGTALAGSTLSLRVTGAEIAAVPADQTGKFVAMFNLAPSPAPRVLSLVMRMQDGVEVPAEGTVVIAPTVAPVALASATTAEPAAAAEPAAEAAATPAAPAALLVTDEGAKVLQAATDLPGGLVVNVTIDTITYTPEGAVQLAGRGSAERVVRLYLDNAQLTETSVSGAGDWAVTLPEVQPGVYTLRADQLDAEGKVTSRFETPFKRETVEALAAASGAGEAVVEAGAEATAEAAAPAVAPSSVTVQPGFTLWRIARDTLGEGILYVQVFEANKDQIRDPDLIYPGQVFTIPKE
ncbi:LysM peptidoglycan-binding domain-containing protein [Tabrizicola sp. M-4]|uniref:LysM peptidoglycan-binding domain-containing protein n=1 Tax=Tabrizicola sp. M-4 TaxID=3055847 RepID=UPI003DA939B6